MALVVAAVGALPLLSCGQRSLVLLDVRASTAFADPTALQDVRLTVVANHEVTTRYPRIRLLTSSSYQIGMYLPSDMTGTVTFEATIDDGRCVIGAGSAVATGVQSGETTAAIPLIIDPTTDCGNVDGGTAGTGGTGGTGTAGAGGMTGGAGVTGSAGSSPAGTGGTGATAGGSGTIGSGGSGGATAGTAGRGGTTGTAGVSGAAGTTGAAGRGGTSGTAGVSGAAGTTGATGRGGTTGTAGVSGAAGTTGAAGVGGMTGTAGRGGTTGAGGVAGVGGGGPGVGGSGGVAGVGGGGPGVGGSGVGGSSTGTGGTTGTAGTGGFCGTTACLPPWMCSSQGTCVCSETPAQACARAGIPCGYVIDNCGQQQFCMCPIANTICDTQTNRCFSGCTTGTGGIVTTEIICPQQPAD
jgi:hypothetical protein